MPVADFSLDGKVAIVTGGSRGIGRSIAIGLAEAGASVAIAARKPESLEEAVAATEAAAQGRGSQAIGVATNVRRMEELQTLVDETKKQLGRVDILINNAATNPVFGSVENIDERAWDTIMNTNVKSCFFLSKMAREVMVEQGDGGAIINVSSTGGVRSSDVLGGYSISKAALIMMTQVCAKEWGPDGIRVNCIAPGPVYTPMVYGRGMSEEARDQRRAGATPRRLPQRPARTPRSVRPRRPPRNSRYVGHQRLLRRLHREHSHALNVIVSWSWST